MRMRAMILRVHTSDIYHPKRSYGLHQLLKFSWFGRTHPDVLPPALNGRQRRREAGPKRRLVRAFVGKHDRRRIGPDDVAPLRYPPEVPAVWEIQMSVGARLGKDAGPEMAREMGFHERDPRNVRLFDKNEVGGIILPLRLHEDQLVLPILRSPEQIGADEPRDHHL